MKKQRNIRKRKKIKRIQTILILIISVILGSTLLASLNKYKETTKKVETKELIRELLLTIETVETNDEIEFNDSDTLADIKKENGEKLKAINKYKNIETFNRINMLTLGDAKKIANNEVDFVVDREGNFLRLE
ncbi:type II secretion system protein [Clostridium sp.]|uniref:type II secretion system protein n=1 Tax=Clostridium sp. TaxID=1506 RepID=UPI0029157142|nr:type II secretion system protein [Clostridium sp.]MDU5107364.1 type II secretion system protein [Clostridium sp.]